MILTGCIAIFLAVLACNRPVANTQPPSMTEPAAQTDDGGQIVPSGLPTLTLQGGSGYLFDTAQVVTGSNDRDVWWNAVELVPGSRMTSLGIMDDPSAVSQVSLNTLSRDQDEPAPGEVYVVEVTPDTDFAILRVLSFGPDREITLEYLYPFTGAITP